MQFVLIFHIEEFFLFKNAKNFPLQTLETSCLGYAALTAVILSVTASDLDRKYSQWKELIIWGHFLAAIKRIKTTHGNV